MVRPMQITTEINNRVAASFIGRWFLLEGCGKPNERCGSRFSTELRAGLTTWAAMAYIIAVNASIISDSGGTCSCTLADGCVNDAAYLSCIDDVKREIITSTAAISALSSFLMGLLANLPVGVAPGLGDNTYFTYSIVGYHGTGMINYREALAAVFMEGWIFLFLSLIGLRRWLVKIMPQSLVQATGAGIGLFITFVGLTSSGLNVIGGRTSTYVSLGGCNAQDYVSPDLVGYCSGHVLRSPTTWLGILIGGFLTVILMMYRVQGAMLVGIFLTAIISWPRPTPVTYFPHDAAGDAKFSFFKQVVSFQKLEKVGNVMDFNFRNGHLWYTMITFLYVDILDTTGALYTMAKFAGLRDPRTLDFENSTMAYCVTAFSISMGSLAGTSPVSVYMESATGIAEGGKTGLTAITTGFLFFISIFFAPIFASIPPWATGGTLIIIGSLMIRTVTEINWDYIGDAVPAFLTLVLIPLTYNVAYGVIAGIISYAILNGLAFLIRKCSNNRITPHNYEITEKATVSSSSLIPSWVTWLSIRILPTSDTRSSTLTVMTTGSNETREKVEQE